MQQIVRSKLFKQQLLEITNNYRDRAGSPVALNFVDEVDAGIRFIAGQPLACAIYTRFQGKAFRKWRLKRFPVSIFFRLDGPNSLVLEALYAHQMNIAARLPREIE